MADENRRNYTRFRLDRRAEVRGPDRRKSGRLRDISGGGAAVIADDMDAYQDDPLEVGNAIDLDVEDMGLYGGEVIRELEEGYAVRFDMDDSERGELISEILENGIAIDD